MIQDQEWLDFYMDNEKKHQYFLYTFLMPSAGEGNNMAIAKSTGPPIEPGEYLIKKELRYEDIGGLYWDRGPTQPKPRDRDHKNFWTERQKYFRSIKGVNSCDFVDTSELRQLDHVG